MIRTSFYIALFCFSFLACEEAEPGPPIPLEELTEIITQALILEPAGRELPIGIQDSVAAIYYGKILAERSYTITEFTASMEWLQADPDRLVTTYNEVMKQLTIIDSER